MSLRRRLTFALSILALAAALASCGGDDDGGGESISADAVVAALSPQSFEEIDSGVLDISLDAEFQGEDEGTANLSLRGPFNSDSADLDGSIDVEGETDFDFDGNLTVTPDNLYFGSADQVYELGVARYAQLKSAAAAGGAVDPTQGFTQQCRAQLKATGGDPAVCDQIDPQSWISSATSEGTESIDDAETEHLRGEVDFRRLLEDGLKIGRESVPPSQRAALDAIGSERIADQIDEVVKEAAINVYRGVDDGITRRVGMDFVFEAEGDEADIGMEVTIEDLNQPQTISAPAGARPIESLRPQIPSLFQPLFDCVLNARTAADLNRCGTQVGGASFTPPAPS